MSTTFERIDLADPRGEQWRAKTYQDALRAAYAEIDRLTSDVEFWKQQQIDACVEANGLAVQCEQQEAEIDRLRANALEWVTVTEDPATLPKPMEEVLLRKGDLDQIVSWVQPDGAWGTPYTGITDDEPYGVAWPVEPGDRWAYIPKPDEVPA